MARETARGADSTRTPHEVSAAGERHDGGILAVERLLLKDSEAAGACGISTAHLWRLWASGRFPRGVLLGRCRRWSLPALREFVAGGCKSIDSEHHSDG